MKRDVSPCDPQLLRQSLDDTLSEEQDDRLAAHLTDCAACRERLESLAAERRDWSRVGEILRTEASSADSPSAGWSSMPAVSPAQAAASLAADFAVHFLEPSTAVDAIGRLDDIDIYGVIGHGGMGIVLRGFQQELRRPVAVKVMAPHLATSGAARQRFAREAQSAAVIVHPHVMPILTVHSSGKLPYLVMPYVACESLEQRLGRDGPLPTIDVLRIGMQVAAGLSAAHAQGLVHRDIKPANILLERGIDRAMLTDFGLARTVDDATLTRSGVIAGTPQYMSPEQARGEAVDARSDMYSLGSVLYAMSTGRPPFRAETSFGVLRRITDTEARPIYQINAEIPAWLAAIIACLHAKQPAARRFSATELAALLEQCLAHQQQPSAVPLPESAASLLPASPRSRGKRLFLGAAALALVVIASLAVVLSMPAVQWTRPDVGEQRPVPATEMNRDDAGRGAPSPPPYVHGAGPLRQDAIDRAIDDLEASIEQLEAEVWATSAGVDVAPAAGPTREDETPNLEEDP